VAAVRVREEVYAELRAAAERLRLPLARVIDMWPRSPCCGALLLQDPLSSSVKCSRCGRAYRAVEG
jgi:hypothetical protein